MKQQRKLKRHFYICLFLSVLFTINLIRDFNNPDGIQTINIIFALVIYVATILAALTLKGSSNN